MKDRSKLSPEVQAMLERIDKEMALCRLRLQREREQERSC
jgi:hypothetical protein